MADKPPPKSPLDDEDWGPLPAKGRGGPRPAIVAFALEATASALLLYFAAHVHVDRSRRLPDFRFSGPLGSRVEALAMAAWLMTLIALKPAVDAVAWRRGGGRPLAYLAILLAIANALGCCLYGSLMET